MLILVETQQKIEVPYILETSVAMKSFPHDYYVYLEKNLSLLVMIVVQANENVSQYFKTTINKVG